MQTAHDQTEKEKLVVVVGPTASGKTTLAIKLATRFSGEVISADSRQVYRGLDIGTEKVSPDEMQGIPHHLIDIADPEEVYTAAHFTRDATRTMTDIRQRNRVPIIAGGTLFYIDALLGRQQLTEVTPNTAVRSELEKKTTTELFEQLKEKDPRRAEEIDPKNRRRIIRALEIVAALGSVPETKKEDRYNALILGIRTEPEELRERIDARIEHSLKKGLLEETETLLKANVSEMRLNEIGLEYRVVLRHLHGRSTYEEMVTELKQKVWQYAKRQRTWLKRDASIKWFSSAEYDSILHTVENFWQR